MQSPAPHAAVQTGGWLTWKQLCQKKKNNQPTKQKTTWGGLSQQQLEHEPVVCLQSNSAVANMSIAIRSGEVILPLSLSGTCEAASGVHVISPHRTTTTWTPWSMAREASKMVRDGSTQCMRRGWENCVCSDWKREDLRGSYLNLLNMTAQRKRS